MKDKGMIKKCHIAWQRFLCLKLSHLALIYFYFGAMFILGSLFWIDYQDFSATGLISSSPQKGQFSASGHQAISSCVVLVGQRYSELTLHRSILPFLIGWVSGRTGSLPGKLGCLVSRASGFWPLGNEVSLHEERWVEVQTDGSPLTTGIC